MTVMGFGPVIGSTSRHPPPGLLAGTRSATLFGPHVDTTVIGLQVPGLVRPYCRTVPASASTIPTMALSDPTPNTATSSSPAGRITRSIAVLMTYVSVGHARACVNAT